MQFKKLSDGGSKNYLKLKDGESVTGIFRGEPYDFRTHWGNGRSTVCTGAACPECKAGGKSSFRFRINFITSENGALVAKVFEQGKSVYSALGSLHSTGYDLTKTKVSITRHGSGKNDTQYNVLPLPPPKGVVDKTLEAQLEKIKLNDLSDTQEDDGGFSEATSGPDEVPF